MNNSISVIIPTLNEAENIKRLLTQLTHETNIKVEVIVSDGGSDDGTKEIVLASGVKLLNSPRGRGKQLNNGAKYAKGKILLFLHADSILPANYEQQITKAVAAGYIGGAHCIQFSPTNSFLKIVAWGSNVRGKYLKSYYGDQGIFVLREVFEELGGFSTEPLMEDVAFSKKMCRYSKGGTVFLVNPITTSSRRFLENGVIKTWLKMQLVKLMYVLGFSVDTLKKIYK